MSEPRIALCSWCRTELPDTGDWMQDAGEVHHHFLIVHGERVNYGVHYVYPGQFEREFHEWEAARIAAGVDGETEQR